MSEKKRKILATSTVYQRGKTQVPKEVREILELDDGSRIVWLLEDGEILIKNADRYYP